MMSQPKEHFLINRRGLLVFAGLLVQIAVIVLVILSVKQPGESSVVLVPIAMNTGNPAVCRVSSIAPFSDAWLYGMQERNCPTSEHFRQNR